MSTNMSANMLMNIWHKAFGERRLTRRTAPIEKFERSAKLPVTGEATGRTLRELMARAGHG